MADALQLYRWMRTARCIDEAEQGLVARGEAFFQVIGSGHEASAALAPALQPGDYLHCHYRDKALMLARGLPISEFFDSLIGNTASRSAGRQMSAHLSAPALNILSLPGPVGNSALQAVGVVQEIESRPERPIVLCALGDGTTQQGEVLEAIAESVRSCLPAAIALRVRDSAEQCLRADRVCHSPPVGSDASHAAPARQECIGAAPQATSPWRWHCATRCTRECVRTRASRCTARTSRIPKATCSA
jgi:hypothetical protein